MTAAAPIQRRDSSSILAIAVQLVLDLGQPSTDDRDPIAAFLAYRDNASPYDPRKAPIPY